MIRRLLSVLLLLAPTACAPIVTHGPRVERGLYGTATLGLPRGLCDSSCDLTMMPQYGFGVRYGRPAEEGKVGYSVAGMISTGLFSTEADLYLQAPTTSEWAAGGGVLLAPTHVMPYVQLGKMREDGSGFYTTQGFAVLAPRPREWLLDEFQDAAPRYWAPTLAYRTPHQGGAIHFYLSGAFGWMELSTVETSDPETRTNQYTRPMRVVMAGITFEQHIPEFFLGPSSRRAP